MNFAPSAITDLNKVIESHNPFDRSLVVRTHDVWESNFPDLTSINSHVSDALFQGIEQIRKGQRSVLGITVRAEKGLGKSHLISRIRHRIKNDGGSFFVYMSETDYGDLDRINSQFLNTLAFSLKQPGSQGVMQWQELASALVNQIFKSDHQPQQIVNRFPGAFARNPKLIEELTAKACRLKPDIKDPYVIQAILWTLSPERCVFAINWLAGKELGQAQADAMGLPNPSEEDRESRALSLAGQILDLVGDYRTIVVCFDEVEPKDCCTALGLNTPQVVALLAKDLYSKIKRGALMLAIFPGTWTNQVMRLPQAESVKDRIGEKVLDLRYLNSDDVVNLVSFWVKDFYDTKGLTPPQAVYPFDENELRELGKERPIVRRVLQWCYENWKIPGEKSLPQSTDPIHNVEVAFNEELAALESHISDYLEDSALIAEALGLGLLTLEGETIGGVKIEQIEEVEAKSCDKGYLHFRIVCRDRGKPTKIVVSVLQESGTKYVSAALRRLVDYKKFDMTRGCLVRSKTVKDGTKGAGYLAELLKKKGGEWVLLKAEDIKPLLAALFVYSASEDYELEKEQILEFIKQRKLAENNYLICEILSDPSGQVPDGVVDEDKELEKEIGSSVNKNTAQSLDDLLSTLTP